MDLPQRHPFRFDVAPADLFAERAGQFVAWGIPAALVGEAEASIRAMWLDGPGGWAWEWSALARREKRRGRLRVAASLYGAAKFPCAVTPAQRDAFDEQIACALAAPELPLVRLVRRVLDVPYRGTTTRVPVHLLRRTGRGPRPLVCLTGGIDTWKIELHRVAVALALVGGMDVAALDMPGTGESEIALAGDADVVYRGVLDSLARDLGAPKRAIFGISFGGHWAAKLACLGAVDAAVDLGGPVGAKRIDLLALPNGMPGATANVIGLASLPREDELDALLVPFSLPAQGLFEEGPRVPLLVVNGDRDVYIPREDTEVFRRWPNAEVWLLPGSSHCAADRIRRVLALAIGWLRERLVGDRRARLMLAAGRALATPRPTFS